LASLGFPLSVINKPHHFVFRLSASMPREDNVRAQIREVSMTLYSSLSASLRHSFEVESRGRFFEMPSTAAYDMISRNSSGGKEGRDWDSWGRRFELILLHVQ
jgi:hypothetical protein